MSQALKKYERDVGEFFSGLGPLDFEGSHCFLCDPGQDPSIKLFDKGTMSVHRCSCGMVYNGRQPTQDALDRFYEQSEAMSDWAEIKASYIEKNRQEAKFAWAVSELKADGVRSVLDIGCGTGKFLSMLRDEIDGIEVLGVDANRNSLKIAADNGVPTHYGTLRDLEKDKKYDVVSMWGLLEHVKDPRHLLTQARSLLNRDGQIIVCVPNVASTVVETLWERCFTFCPQHLWYFNPHTLARTFDRAGLRPTRQRLIEREERPIRMVLSGFQDPYAKPPPDWALRPLPGDPIKGYKIVSFAACI